MKSRFKVIGLMSAVLLIFGMGSVASADNAASINVAISYPCASEQSPCDTGVAVSDWVDGDFVNVYITLLDAAGNPATAGPNGEALTALTARLTTQLGVAGSVDSNTFLVDDNTVNFAGKASARANIDYSQAMAGVDPINVDITGANPLTASANVNIVAPDAVTLTTRTCADADYDLYDEVGPDCGENVPGREPYEAGSSIAFQVIAEEGNGRFTTAPNLEGQQIMVKAYADYDGNEAATPDSAEETPVASGTFTMTNGIAEGELVINCAGPNGLDVVFIADAIDIDAAGTDIGTLDLDLVTMIPGDPAAIVVGDDPFENGNLIVPAEDNCVTVLDDSGECEDPGTPRVIQLVIVDALGNAVDAEGTVTVTGTLDGILDEQLDGCEETDILSYAGTCSLFDDDGDSAGSVVIGPLPFTATGLDGTSLSVYLLPASGCGDLDMQVSVPAAAINAGDTVTLTITSEGSIPVVSEGHDLLITAGGGTQLLSSNGFASASTTLQINNVLDADDEAAGIQVEIQMYGPCTTAVEPVAITVTDLDQCGAWAASGNIADIQPGDPVNLAVVGLDADMETESVLDESGTYVGTAPIVIDSYIIANGTAYTEILDDTDGCCDLQLWDEFTNVEECEPEFTCTTDSGFALPVLSEGCGVAVAFASGAAGTTATVTCGADIDEDPELDLTRTFQLTNIVNVIPDDPEEPSDAATALAVIKEGPQSQAGAQINPLPGGEAIIKILPNGSLGASVNVQIAFGAGSVAGAELRNLNGTAVILPVTITLTAGSPEKRYVVYAPAAGQVVVTATEVSATGLTAGTGTVVFGAACEVAIAPATPTVAQGGTLQLTATTTCEGTPTAGTYTWAVLESECTSSGTISETGLYSAPAVGGCTETVRATDTANGNVTADVIITVSVCTPEVQISGNTNLTVGASQTYTAATTCGGAPLTGTYSWELNGAAVGTGNSYTFTATTAGTNTLEVTDTTNNVTDTVTITVVSGCSIEVAQDQVVRSRWIPLPALLTITCEGDDCDFKLIGTRVEFETASLFSVIPAGRLVFPNQQTILQLVLIGPALLTGGLDQETETVTVTVTDGGCDTGSDTFEITLLPFFLDKQQ